MSNQHNPIARTIEKLQIKWAEATNDNSECRLIRWMIEPDNAPLINGFYKIESSRFGSLPEFFIVQFNSFEDNLTFSKHIILDWTNIWENDPSVKEAGAVWDIYAIREKLLMVSPKEDADKLFIEVLEDFRQKFCREDQHLVFVIIPRAVSDFSAFNEWLISVVERLPQGIKISLIDHIGKNYLKKAFKELKEQSVTIEYKDSHINDLAKEMATSGDPNNPEIEFRKCIFEMSDGLIAKKVKHIDIWGTKAISVAQKTGLPSMVSTAYLIYAGFLLQLKKEEADELLDKGIMIAENAHDNGDANSSNVLMQLYAYKAAYQRIKGDRKKSCYWLLKQARMAVVLNLNILAISQYRMLARISKQAWENEICSLSLKEGYEASEKLTEEELKVSEVKILAYNYIEELKYYEKLERAVEIEDRMKKLFGERWYEDLPDLSDKYGETIPRIEDTVETMNLNNL